MFCPRCRTEYVEGVTRCDDCGVALVATLDPLPEERPEWLELVTVLETTDPTLLEVARSLLEAEQIPCIVQGERVQDLVGLGRAPLGVNLATGPALLQVPAELAEAARELLADRAEELGADSEPPTPEA